MLRPFFPELVISTDLLSFEHPSVLLFCSLFLGVFLVFVKHKAVKFGFKKLYANNNLRLKIFDKSFPYNDENDLSILDNIVLLSVQLLEQSSTYKKIQHKLSEICVKPVLIPERSFFDLLLFQCKAFQRKLPISAYCL